MRALTVVKNLLADSVEVIEAELGATKDAGAAACAEIERLEAAKLDADTWQQAEAIDKKLAHQRWLVAVAHKKIPVIESRLAAARATVREELKRKLMAPIERTVTSYLQKAADCRQAFDKIIELRHALSSNGFESEAQAVLLGPHINGSPFLATDLLQLAEAELRRRTNGPKTTPRAVDQPPAKQSQEPKPVRMTDTQRAVRLDEPPPVQQRSKRAPRRDPPPTDETKCLVTILRSGVDLRGIGQCAAGDRVAIDREAARKLVESGAADFVRPGTQLAPFPSTDIKL